MIGQEKFGLMYKSYNVDCDSTTWIAAWPECQTYLDPRYSVLHTQQ